jgi:hypothetical protein
MSQPDCLAPAVPTRQRGEPHNYGMQRTPGASLAGAADPAIR